MAGYIKYQTSKQPGVTLVADINIHQYKLPDELVTNLWLIDKIEVTLSNEEIQYAINNCGAAVVQSEIASYFGDEAKRIIANWVKK